MAAAGAQRARCAAAALVAAAAVAWARMRCSEFRDKITFIHKGYKMIQQLKPSPKRR